MKNALKFTSGGTIQIVTSYDTHNELLKCSVIDTGLGFDEEVKAQLFRAFGKAE